MCFGMMYDSAMPIWYRKLGFWYECLKMTVLSSGVSMAVIDLFAMTPVGCLTIRPFSYVNFTSADVNGVPSCHFTPLRSLKVIVSPSGEMVHDSASSGFSSSFAL